MKPAALLSIAAGGAVGALARWTTYTVWTPAGEFPWPTFAVNVVGSALLAAVVVHLRGRWSHRPNVVDALAVGFCGGLTTFSTFSVEAAELSRAGRTGLAVLYLGASVVAGVAAAGLVGHLVREAEQP